MTGDSAEAIGGTVRGRDSVIKAYRAQRFKYLVSIGTLTTGFDVEHTSVIALLRKTESASLLQQIMGRAWRLDPMKPKSYVLDFAGNIEDHFPDGDIYAPVIRASGSGEGGGTVKAECPDCGYENDFTIRKDSIDMPKDKYGYAVDLDGNQVLVPIGRDEEGEEIKKPMPVHHGRRCWGHDHKAQRCSYRWTHKECPHCHEANDIAARYCAHCKGEIIDPNEKLIAEFQAMKKDPKQLQTDIVLNMTEKESVSMKGNKTWKVSFTTPYRTFTVWFSPESTAPKPLAFWKEFQRAREQGIRTVTYMKDAASGFYRIHGYNMAEDVEPAM